MGILDIMRISVASLNANQTAMSVVSHNVANMNTVGYSRQESVMSPAIPREDSGLLLGMGVELDSIQNVEDRFIAYNLTMSYQDLGFLSVKATGLNQVQEVFNESNDAEGLSAVMNDFWNAWSDLASNPESSSARESLRGTANILINEFNTANTRLKDLADAANMEISYIIDDANAKLDSIAELNVLIRQAELAGTTASDYRSERQQMMQELSTLLDYNYFEDETGMVTITVSGGLPLVESETVNHLELRADATNYGYYNVVAVSSGGQEFDLTDKMDGGEIAGHIAVRDEYIGEMRDKLDELAYTIVQEVNNLHTTGFNLSGATGVNFFAPLASVDGAAGSIQLDAAIETSADNIAASLTGSVGDNQIANQINALSDELTMNGGSATFQDYFSSMVSKVGSEAQNAELAYTHAEAVNSQLYNVRESISGVAIEEEMSNLIRFQQAYQAAARMLNAASQMIDVLNSIE
ncbi:MAG TPA: flagellar hook-associated protein FlgK [bacterium]|nr:flagellar hook-associated protein FlgK [bacterium]